MLFWIEDIFLLISIPIIISVDDQIGYTSDLKL